MHLGELLARSGRIQDAIQQFEFALTVHPHHEALRNNLATACFIEGDLPRAEVHYREALRVQPNYFNARFNLGRVLASQGRKVQAKQELDRALVLQPGNAEVLEALRNLDS